MPHPLQHGHHRHQPGTVKRSIHQPQTGSLAQLGAQRLGHHRGIVPLNKGIANVFNASVSQRFLKVRQLHIPEDIRLFNLLGNSGRYMAGDLRTVGGIGLVAVVPGGVVAGGHHHAARTVPVQHRKGKRRGGHQVGIQIDLNAVGGQYLCRFPRKNITLVAAVVGNGSARFFILRQQVGGKALGGLPHGIDVHTVGAGAQLAPQPAGAKFQRPVKALMYLFFLIADGQKLGGKLRVGHFLQPAA